jgi:DNA modification methylase
MKPSKKDTFSKLEVTYRPIESLIPYARNSRTHSDAQVAQIAASIREFGWTNPVLIDAEGGIIAGHGRIMAGRKLGITEAPCIILDGLTEAQRRAYVIADNKLALNAGWDVELLKIELGDLKALDFDLSLTGFDPGELGNLLADKTEGLTDEDAVPETPARAVTVLGDVWLLGKHRVMCGDSTSIDAVDTLMAGGKANMVLSDPPYGMFLDTDFSTIKGSMKSIGKKNKTEGNKYDKVIGDHDDFTPDLINTFFANFGYCKEIFLWGADYYAELLPGKNEGSWLVWDKRKESQADAIGAEFELCWSKQKHKRRMLRHDWFGFLSSSNPTEARNRVHPTQKPTTLMQDIMEQWGDVGDVVADLYGGSGSTLLACEKIKRQARLMELDPKYCDVIIKRWQDFTGQKATLESSGQTFDDIATSRYDWEKDASGSYTDAIAAKRAELEASS